MERPNPFGYLSLLVFAGGLLIFDASLSAMPERELPVLLGERLPEPPPLRSAIFEPTTTMTLSMRITAYTSSPEETDDTPFVTASGTRVRDGVVATNQLPFGARIQMPTLFGDKVFVVEDRMHERYPNEIDIWMGHGKGAKERANAFGWKIADVVVLNSLDEPSPPAEAISAH